MQNENTSETCAYEAFKKTVRLGTARTSNGRAYSIFCKIEFTSDGKLSISGVEGPLSDGNCVGGCGQIDMHLRTEQSSITLAPGWTRKSLATFFDVWRDWHLNDMRAACVHQRALGWDPSKTITLYYYRLKPEIEKERREAKSRAIAALQTSEPFTATERQIQVSTLPDRITSDMPELSELQAAFYMPNGPQYSGDYYNLASETKLAGWVKESEHPDGLLSKPCPTCGYEYGSSWLREDVPSDVLDFLRSLPDTDKQPAWV